MYRKKIVISPSEAGCSNEVKIKALLDIFQDTASVAVKDKEGSPGALMARGYAWVLLKYEIEVVTRSPGMDEEVIVETRHTLGDGFHTLRVFRVFSASDESKTLVLAKTSWVLIDLAAARPVRAIQHIPEVFEDVFDDLPIDPDFLKIQKLKKSDDGITETLFPVRFHDLDANGHVNNAVYFEWAFEATPLDLTAWSVKSMRAEFDKSVKYKDTVRVRVQEIENHDGAREFIYDIINASGNTASRFASRFVSV
ncbi:acyl-ACP thioesterase [Synergistales bacterium]|nr:acyl-ACP thioesterase [Synergistales bacterium]